MRAVHAPRRPRQQATAGCGLLLAAALLLPLALLPAAHAEGPFDEEQVGDSPYPVEFRTAVNAAIDRGVAELRRTQLPDGSWPSAYARSHLLGPTALATLTLLKCGVKPEEPCILRAFEHMKTRPLAQTYEVGLLLMALAARYSPAHETFEPDETDRYGNVKPKDPCASAISKEDLAWMKRGVDFLLTNQNGDGSWRYPSGGTDLSNTQYALLGLQAANRCGSLVPLKAWLAALEFLLGAQVEFGKPVLIKGNEVRGRYRFQWSEPALMRGFRYIPGNTAMPPTGSMTTAGLAGLIICQSEVWESRRFTAELRLKARRGIRDAMAWLQENFDVEDNPVEGPQADGAQGARWRPSRWHLYYLYGLERAGILGRFRFVGARDWYQEGADVLVGSQADQGSWGGLDDTCFALLFLKRATTRHGMPVITPADRGPPAAAPAPAAPAGNGVPPAAPAK